MSSTIKADELKNHMGKTVTINGVTEKLLTLVVGEESPKTYTVELETRWFNLSGEDMIDVYNDTPVTMGNIDKYIGKTLIYQDDIEFGIIKKTDQTEILDGSLRTFVWNNDGDILESDDGSDVVYIR